MTIGTPLQAMKFAVKLNNDMSSNFMVRFIAGEDMSAWGIPTGATVDTQRVALGRISFAEFCAANPDEPERADGRKAHYGTGRQPLDDIIEAGWGPAFCAGNVLKYLRRDKMVEDSAGKARWYFKLLTDKANGSGLDAMPWIEGGRTLTRKLTRDEMDVLGLPSCFQPIKE